MLRMLLGPVLGPVRPIVLFFEPFRSIWLLGPVQIQQLEGSSNAQQILLIEFQARQLLPQKQPLGFRCL